MADDARKRRSDTELTDRNYEALEEATAEPISGRVRRSYVPGGNNHHAVKRPDLLAIVRRSLAGALMCASIRRNVTQQSRKLDTVPQND